MNVIKVIDAYENNLKHVSIDIPKNKITVFTGVSGSGKSSLCMNTIAAESRRELNDTFPSFVQQYLPKYGRPKVGKIEHLPVTMILDQKKPSVSSRSTISTYTDIQAFLRLLFSRFGKPFVGYSDMFSFNHPKGRCQICEGLGETTTLDIHKLVDFDKCLNDEGVINFPAFTTGAWRWKRYAYSGLFDLDKKIRDYDENELALFLHAPQMKLKNPPENWPKSAKYEGIFPRMYRSIIYTKEGKRHKKILDNMITKEACKSCGGSRYNEAIHSCKINGENLPSVLEMAIPDVLDFVKNIEHEAICDELIQRLTPLIDVGLGYLTLSRGMNTLSGGELQRVKISKYINSALTDVMYVLDEPSAGLHHHDIERLKSLIYALRNRGNTVLMVEHHQRMIEMADHIVEMGPGAGRDGGSIVFTGTYDQLLQTSTVTNQMLKQHIPFKKDKRSMKETIHLSQLTKHNLKAIDVSIPLHALTVIAGVAGAGKSTLASCIEACYDGPCTYISSKGIGLNSRSTPATYLGISDDVRQLFSKQSNLPLSYFSFNAKGACPVCKGKGMMTTEMGFMDQIESVCEACQGLKFNEMALSHVYQSKTIAQVYEMSVDEAIDFFAGHPLVSKLNDLKKVGLGYLSLNRSISTLSGGERQRLKLAASLSEQSMLFILDEPTDGLHLHDVHRLLHLFDEMIESGSTLVVVDHHLDVIKASDHLIELGPAGGFLGGHVLYEGIPEKMALSPKSITKCYI